MQVKFYDDIDDKELLFAVIVAQYNGKWLLCRHKERDTYEIPGGHRENKESITACAKRELYEESGADDYRIYPISVYSCIGKTRVKESYEDKETYGMLFYADVKTLHTLPDSEIGEIKLFDHPQDIPAWTYPEIQPKLLNYVIDMLKEKC